MKYVKRNERFMKSAVFAKCFKDAGATVKEVAEYSKWRELDNGSRVQVTFTIMVADARNIGGLVGYYMKDNFGMVASDTVADINEIKSWLTDKGFKTIHDWYVQDCGMSEETWKEWNGSND